MTMRTRLGLFNRCLAAFGCQAPPLPSAAHMPGWTSAAALNGSARKGLQQLYAKTPAAKAIGDKAHAVLVFPSITNAGLGIQGNKISKISPK